MFSMFELWQSLEQNKRPATRRVHNNADITVPTTTHRKQPNIIAISTLPTSLQITQQQQHLVNYLLFRTAHCFWCFDTVGWAL